MIRTPTGHFDPEKVGNANLEHVRTEGIDKVPVVLDGLSQEQKALVMDVLRARSPNEKAKVILIDGVLGSLMD